MRRLSIGAAREVRHSPERVYEFLACLENHRQLGGPSLRVADLDGDGLGGHVIVGGPLGLRRTARTSLTEAHAPALLGGLARVGRHTQAEVRWTIAGGSTRGARVALEATLGRAGLLDRTLLAIGGAWWLRRAFDRALAELAATLDRRSAEGVAVSDECAGARRAERRFRPVPAVPLHLG